MYKRFIGFFMILVICMIVPFEGYAATPRETVENGVNKVLKILNDPAFRAKTRDEKIAKIATEIDAIFDFEELSKRTLGRDWKKMKAERQEEFVTLFKKLLQGVYADRLLAYSDQKVIFEKELMLKEGRAEVQSYILSAEGSKIPLFYRLTDKSGSWKTYDMIIEGVSLVKNYRTQFREVLANDSPEKLIEILREKVNKGESVE